MSLPLLFGLLLPHAWAGVPVVALRPEDTSPLEVAAGRSGLPVSELSLVPLSDLLSQPAQVLGEGVLRRCATSPTSMSTVRTALARAEAALREHDERTAFDQLDLAVADLGCLSELAQPQVAGRVFQLRGALLGTQSADDGKAELRTAVGFTAELPWQSSDPNAGASLLVDVIREPLPHVVQVSPPQRSSGPWLDGAPFPDGGHDVRKGLHLLQYATPAGIRSAWLVVGGDARVVLPMAFREPILDVFVDERARMPVVDLVAAGLPDFKAAYVSHAGGLWLVSQVEGNVEVSELITPPPPKTEEEIEAESGKGKKGKKGKKIGKG